MDDNEMIVLLEAGMLMVLQIMSNGTYRNINHRATINSLKERIYVTTFCNPKIDGDIGPAPSLVTLETPAIFKRIGVVDYTKGLFFGKLDGKAPFVP
ncbi:hypothetical protein EZV62_027074 [Acer yangbiense]|uniref:Isopenicillin N synthase-like Fe(2+) 2OG dioxygenase domain-containing protein n=1 Tax=Acer yangbiense TaxID=1000413 RepID=A0A5C7GT91_9ROSI|nr:hypothetical protein EZV62_027074 [Acer yangbiense]